MPVMPAHAPPGPCPRRSPARPSGQKDWKENKIYVQKKMNDLSTKDVLVELQLHQEKTKMYKTRTIKRCTLMYVQLLLLYFCLLMYSCTIHVPFIHVLMFISFMYVHSFIHVHPALPFILPVINTAKIFTNKLHQLPPAKSRLAITAALLSSRYKGSPFLVSVVKHGNNALILEEYLCVQRHHTFSAMQLS